MGIWSYVYCIFNGFILLLSQTFMCIVFSMGLFFCYLKPTCVLYFLQVKPSWHRPWRDAWTCPLPSVTAPPWRKPATWGRILSLWSPNYCRMPTIMWTRHSKVTHWCLTLMLLVFNLTNAKWCKKTFKNYWNPGSWVLIWEYSARVIQWIPASEILWMMRYDTILHFFYMIIFPFQYRYLV